MSRCFPFPPPGYEKKPRSSSSELGNLLAKEKHREKKHKKEKDKEKRESKERKDKERSKDKHKEKKDKKEKHKDKKRDKGRDKDKDKTRTSEDQRSEHQSAVHHDGRLGYDNRKADEVGDSKFTEELGRRIRGDKHEAANRMLEDFSVSMHRRAEQMGASTAMGREGVTGNKMVTNVTSTMPRRDENLTSSFQKRTEGLETAIALEKQKVASSGKAPDFMRRYENLTPPMQRRMESMGTVSLEKERAENGQRTVASTSAEQGNHVTNHSMDNLPSLVQRKTEGIFSVNSIQKDRVNINHTLSNPNIAAVRINDGMAQSFENFNSSVLPGSEKTGIVSALKTERPLLPKVVQTEQGRTDGMKLVVQTEQGRTDGMKLLVEKDRPAEKDPNKKLKEKENTKEKTAEDGKREGHKDKDRREKKKEKKKEKEKDRLKEKKKEDKKREKSENEHSKHDKVGQNGIKDQIDSLINNMTFAPHVETIKTVGSDGNCRKRKESEMNGFLHELQHDERPNKLPRANVSSHPPMENQRVEFGHIAFPGSSIKNGGINNIKLEKGLDNNGSHINGKAKVHLSHALRSSVPPVALDSSKNDQVPIRPSDASATVNSSKRDRVPSRPPHPDTKYLSTIYAIPKIEELPGFDDEDWLFSSENPRSNRKPEAEETSPPEVWAKGLQIEAADVFALPYVIPF